MFLSGFLSVLVVLCTSIQVFSFHHQRPMMAQNDGKIRSINARPVGLQRSALMAGFLGGLFAKDGANANDNVGKSPTNEVVGVVNGIRQKRLGGTGDIVVSELALGTQRWVSDDFNAPNEELCFSLMDKAILGGGINLLDTAEQYPIPSSPQRPEGLVERTIGKWMARSPDRRAKVIISTKITGGRNVNRLNIFKDCEGSLKRLGTDYIDVYMLHWPARYTPQSNWGQSLQYQPGMEQYYKGNAGFEEICLAMGDLIKQGKIRGWGLCNDNAFGLTSCCEIAKRLGVSPIVAMQNDYSLIDRRAEENGVSEASAPMHENVGFMAYNVLAGGVLAGTYLNSPPPYDNPSFTNSMSQRKEPRGRHDETGWGRTLYRYRSGPANEATIMYEKIAKKNGLSLLELSLRWAQQRQPVTTCLLGQTSMKQLEEQIKIFQKGNKERLSDQLLWDVDVVHMRNRLPIFSSTRVGNDWNGEGEIGETIP